MLLLYLNVKWPNFLSDLPIEIRVLRLLIFSVQKIMQVSRVSVLMWPSN